MTISDAVGTVDFPTLGDLIDQWIEQHCFVPGGVLRGKAFRQYDWQFWCAANHYRVREDAVWDGTPLLNQAFVHRRSQVVAPQKTGKGPWTACLSAVEAVGPSTFGGWAKRGEAYRCEDFGCGCGWYFDYEKGEPKGMRHPSPLIQIAATSEEQADRNVFAALRFMAHRMPLKGLLSSRDGWMKIHGAAEDDPDFDRIDIVTAAANSKLGNPISMAFQDETGLYTDANKLRKVAETQRRGAAGMGGRTMETTNAWDPSQKSVAETTYEATVDDVFRFYRNPDANPDLRRPDGKPLRYSVKSERARIHAWVYEGSDHVNLDSIEAEAAELMLTDPAQAERFFGNRIVAGGGTWLPEGLWTTRRHDLVAA